VGTSKQKLEKEDIFKVSTVSRSTMELDRNSLIAGMLRLDPVADPAENFR
jgi:hypothetical protein